LSVGLHVELAANVRICWDFQLPSEGSKLFHTSHVPDVIECQLVYELISRRSFMHGFGDAPFGVKVWPFGFHAGETPNRHRVLFAISSYFTPHHRQSLIFHFYVEGSKLEN
jgi:hypothetical protein